MPRGRDRIAQWLVASVLALAALAIGGADRWVIVACAALAAIAAGTALTSQREMTQLSPLLAFLGLAALLTLLQIVPMPALMVAQLSPGKYALVADNARALGESTPSWIALSLDPPATLLELVKLAAYATVGYVALRLSASAQGRTWLITAVALLGVAVALISLAHRIVGASRVYGFYELKQVGHSPFVGPLLNQNHLAGLMAFTVPITLGLALGCDGQRRVAWIAGALVCAAVNLLAESREGTAALVLGLAAFGGLFALHRRHGSRNVRPLRKSDAVAIVIATVSGLVLLGAFTAGGLAKELASTSTGELTGSTGKIEAWRSGAPMLDEYPWVGIGRGAFEFAATRAPGAHQAVFFKVENEFLQAAIDWGFVGAAALALVFVWLATTAIRRGRSGAWEAGAVAGLVALVAENLADFSLWMPGVALPAVVAAATLLHVPLNVASKTTRLRLRVVRAIGLTVVAGVIALGASPVGRQARDETDALAREFARRPDPALAVAHAKEVLARHPSDFVAAGLTADALFAARDRRAVAVANRALAMHPTNGELHRLVGTMLLASQRREQAAVEYALALKYRLRDEILAEILARFPDDADAVLALPLDPKLVKEIADRITMRERTSLTIAYLERYLSLNPEDSRILLYTSEVALGTGRRELALDTARRGHRLNPTDRSATMLARALLANQDASGAAAMVEQAVAARAGVTRDRVDLLMVLADVQVALGTPAKARESLHSALEVARGKEAAMVHRKLSEIERLLGNAHQADWEAKRAVDLER